MYVVTGLILFLYLFLGYLSRKEDTGEVGIVMRPFYRIALYLYKLSRIHKIFFLVSRQVEADLERLHRGENKQQACTEYYVRKLAKSLLICLVGTLLGLLVSMKSGGDNLIDDTGTVTRGSYEEGAKEIEVECDMEEGTQKFKIQVDAKAFTEEEVNQLFEEFRYKLPEYILRDNFSLQEVSENLCLQEKYEGYPFVVEWESENPEIIHSDGTVGTLWETSAETTIRATISYEEWEWVESYSVKVVPGSFSLGERIHYELEQMLIDSEKNSRTQEKWKLPDSWQGKKIVWKQRETDNGCALLVGGVCVAFLVYLLADKDLHDHVEKRRQQMKRDYVDVVHKLVLYLGAGMTIRGAFQRMAGEYEQERAAGKTERPIYEELVYVCRELNAGVSEGAVYEHFGRRAGVQEYFRLSTLLTQNLKKGNSTLLQRLREEAEKASAEHIQYGKRLAEEAVTKLLLPMVMMLLVIMLMIMIPAFSSVGA